MNLSNSLTIPIEFEKEVDAILSLKGIEVKKKDHMANSAHWPSCEESEDTKTNRYVLYQITVSATFAAWVISEMYEARNRKLLPSPK